ncbi:GNAT family N-acetyltransferase [Frigoriflavimonas asaccharolytica]|uniref:Ribosomal protein S18 acetylase RimI-like enzyme n=1 Tax=Frigoriflavimonas asaccharolytica TaxID=2735899 RepID=A0A8J8K9I0_9FLAO|nr:GNAT family N-acetyltransferase [Frigoriflavimonas asaccharolytica]NRS93661.1 ribosomal protein S18 acetylase RimI-like enzyme [Frigoriflavimonas asaccharolytica]
MEFIQIQDATSERAERIYSHYSQTFPEDERRDLKQFSQLFENKNVEIFGIFFTNKFVGYSIIWTLSDFSFMEHFEIFSEHQNQNFGSTFLKNITEKHPHLILETEPKDLNEDAQKRIKFYERNGFFILQEDYIQPPYSEDKKPITLWLMANYHPQKLEFVKENIYDVVYR